MRFNPAITAVWETSLEVEARIYEGILNEAGLHPLVQTVEDPLLTNVIRQIVLARYQVVVPAAEADRAREIIEQQPLVTVEPVVEDEPAAGARPKTLLLLVGRLLIVLLLLAPICALIRSLLHVLRYSGR